MRRSILSLLGLLLCILPAAAQVPCIGVGGVNNINVPGVACQQEPVVNTYSATAVGLVPASSATDVACIAGAANVAVRVKQIRVSGSAGTLITVPISVVKRASVNTGGTAATGNALPVPYALDSSNSAAKATTTSWTANPTITDSSPGFVDTALAIFNATTAAGNASTNFTFNIDQTETPILRGAAQALCVNLNATSVSSGVVNINFRWTEASQ